ncbi:MAG TPA: hypothetical protein VF765_22805 [Polyangiaceae bacterium]
MASRGGSCPDAGAGAPGCTVARTVVRCMSSREVRTCVTSGTQCPGSTSATGFECVSLCRPDEYGATCGEQQMPRGCTTYGFTQGGNQGACCPCEPR